MSGGPTIPTRLVTVRLRAHVVESMDAAIALSGGAYRDRSEFVSDAVQDKIVADGEGGGPTVPSRAYALRDEGDHGLIVGARVDLGWGAWRGRDVPSRPAEPSHLVCFGLHNRDLPTLLAVDRLAAAAATTRSSVPWSSFVRTLRADAVDAAAQLHRLDQESRRPIKLATSFPRADRRNRSSEDRFIAASVGLILRRADAPMAVLGLVCADADLLLPSTQALALLGDLIDSGLPSTLMPPAAAATRRWLNHLSHTAPGEAAAWRRLLLAGARRPMRSALISSFPEWGGAVAETNCMGLVSRAREWGLVRPEMNEKRYELTALGEQVLEEVA